ncbi:MAG: hypothetical protein IBJ18_06850 [Phycisphaerales bacterium]|nr:hypothetical protein [Phycisphaerales bacterium]
MPTLEENNQTGSRPISTGAGGGARGSGVRVNVRRTGLVVAVAVGLMSAGLVGFVVIQSRSGTPGAAPTVGTVQPGGSAAGGGTETSLPPVAGEAEGVGSDIAKIGGIKRARVQFVDRQDPTRVMGVMMWKSLEPLPGGRATITEPRGVIYLRDGRVISVVASKGTMFRPPKSEEPESGTFEGLVDIKVYAPAQRADGSIGEIDFDRDTPVMTIATQSLRFDRALYEVSTSEKWSLRSPRVTASGQGFRFVGNDVGERLEYGEIDRVDEILISTQSEPTQPGKTVSGGGASESSTPANAPGETSRGTIPALVGPTQSKQTLYRAQVDRGVEIAWGPRTLKGQMAEVWLRLIDNALPEGTFAVDGASEAQEIAGKPSASTNPGAQTTLIRVRGPITNEPTFEPVDQGVLVVAGDTDALASESPTNAAIARVDSQPIRVSWKGRLVVRPIETVPPALMNDDVAVRFSSPAPASAAGSSESSAAQTGLVEFGDAKAGVFGSASALTLGISSRDLSLVGDRTQPVSIRAGERIGFEGESVKINLRSGVGQARGRGTLRQRDPREGFGASGTTIARSIAWEDQSDFLLSSKGGWITGELRQAGAQGKVVAEDRRTRVEAGNVTAIFEKPAAGGGDNTDLQRLIASEGVLVKTINETDPARVSSLKAQETRVEFRPVPSSEGGGSRPVSFSARGDVVASRGENSLSAQVLECDLGLDDRKQTILTRVVAERDVNFKGQRNVNLWADTLSADPRAETAELFSTKPEGVRLSRAGASVLGSHVKLNGPEQELTVVGPGRLIFRRGENVPSLSGEARQPAELIAGWSTSMTISDKLGTGECVGDVICSWSSSPGQNERLWAQRLDLNFTQSDESTGAVGPDGKPEMRRRLLKAVAVGGSERARVESVRFSAAKPSEQASESLGRRLVYLEGERIVVSETAGTLEVPGAGRLLVDERSTRQSNDAGSASSPRASTPGVVPGISQGSTIAGSSLFSWSGSLLLTRATGEAEIVGAARLIHRPESSSKDSPTGILTLDADRLSAKVRLSPVAGATDQLAGDAEFLSASALGNVVAQGADQKRVLAEKLTYDARSRTLEAAGDAAGNALGGRVALVDPTKPNPVAAGKIIWNLATDRIEVVNPMPISTPR